MAALAFPFFLSSFYNTSSFLLHHYELLLLLGLSFFRLGVFLFVILRSYNWRERRNRFGCLLYFGYDCAVLWFCFVVSPFTPFHLINGA